MSDGAQRIYSVREHTRNKMVTKL